MFLFPTVIAVLGWCVIWSQVPGNGLVWLGGSLLFISGVVFALAAEDEREKGRG